MTSLSSPSSSTAPAWGSLQLADLGAEVIKIEDPATGGMWSAPVYRKSGPALAEHTGEILRDFLGYDAGTVDRLTAQGASGRSEWEPAKPVVSCRCGVA